MPETPYDVMHVVAAMRPRLKKGTVSKLSCLPAWHKAAPTVLHRQQPHWNLCTEERTATVPAAVCAHKITIHCCVARWYIAVAVARSAAHRDVDEPVQTQ